MRLAWGLAVAACVGCPKADPAFVDGGDDLLTSEIDQAMPADAEVPGDLAAPRDMTPLYSVGGIVTGVGGTLIVVNNVTDERPITMSGAFAFSKRLPAGATYNVTVKTPPLGQLCSVSAGSGTVGMADVTSVIVSCVPARSVGGTLSGLLAGTVVLRNNGADEQALSTNTSFSFATPVAESSSYDVTVQMQPTGQICTVNGGSGQVMSTDVSVAVQCRVLDVKINEVYARPSLNSLAHLGDTNGDSLRDFKSDEFVEIINNELFTVDISGWVVRTGRMPLVRFTFPPTTMLATGVRAVVFNGGTPSGGFGAGQVFTSTMDLQLLDGPTPSPVPFSVVLASRASQGLDLDIYSYDENEWGGCVRCPSQTRSPEGTGSFTSHASIPVITDGGVLWSPGVSNHEAILKFNPIASDPSAGALNVSALSPITMRFNLYLNPADFVDAKLKLYRSGCMTPANPIPVVVPSPTPRPIPDGAVSMWPTVPLDYGQVHCVEIDGAVRSLVNTSLGATVRYEFTTRQPMSSPAPTVVISEVGGNDFTANNEFVELYNPTMAAIDLSGWQIQRRSNTGGLVNCFATIAGGKIIQPHGYFLIAPNGFSPTPDQSSLPGLGLRGGSESVLLRSPGDACDDDTPVFVVDAVSYGNITDSYLPLQLPQLPTPLANGAAVERKACWDSTLTTMDDGTHGGNAEKIGANNADFVVRASPQPQNAGASPEPRVCPGG